MWQGQIRYACERKGAIRQLAVPDGHSARAICPQEVNRDKSSVMQGKIFDHMNSPIVARFERVLLVGGVPPTAPSATVRSWPSVTVGYATASSISQPFSPHLRSDAAICFDRPCCLNVEPLAKFLMNYPPHVVLRLCLL